MKRRLLTVAIWLLAVRPAAADSGNGACEIVSHKARLNLFPSQNAISATDTLTIHLTPHKPARIKLQLLPVYEVEEVRINGRKSRFERDRDSIEITNLPTDTLFDCVIVYSGVLAFRSEFSQLTRERAVLREEEVLPHGKSMLREARLTVRAPAAWEVLTAGTLVRRDTSMDSTLFVYDIDRPVPTLGWICGGPYWAGPGEGQGPPVSVHLFPEDSGSASGIAELAKALLKFYGERFSTYRFRDFKVVEVEDWVAGPNVLAVAIPAMVMIKRLTLRTDDRFNQVRTILPHEVAHQWWPMTVFLEDADAAFLAEGMCDYSALLFHESTGALSARDSLKHHPLLRPLILRALKGQDLPLQRKADLRSLPTHYLKAAYVHNMLRHLVGDSTFFLLYRTFAGRFAARRVGLSDFQQLAEELSGRKLDWFFNQWVKNRGLPRLKIYNVKSVPLGDQWVTRGRVRIVGYDKFTTFADVGIATGAGMMLKRVWLGADSTGSYRNDVPFEVVSKEKPQRALLDPAGNLLKYERLPVKFSDVRDPADGLMIVGTRKHAGHLLALARKDSASMEMGAWSVTIKRDSEVSLGDLQNERVFIYGMAAENSVAAELEDKFPIKFRDGWPIIPESLRDAGESGKSPHGRATSLPRAAASRTAGPSRDSSGPSHGTTGPGRDTAGTGHRESGHRSSGAGRPGPDSAVSGTNPFNDSTLALLQCIESPYIAQGFLAWIAPLSEQAEPAVFPYDASWVLLRGVDEIISGAWEVKDEDLTFDIN
ncbi:MAG: M1 family metallopeptidase [Ignavibacteria bacterium]|nr:MAG: M1 family metallopeptidase [Ignavibacteria bacterium]